jgi:hypothetical protein
MSVDEGGPSGENIGWEEITQDIVKLWYSEINNVHS